MKWKINGNVLSIEEEQEKSSQHYEDTFKWPQIMKLVVRFSGKAGEGCQNLVEREGGKGRDGRENCGRTENHTKIRKRI